MSYELREEVPDPETFLALREAAGLTPYSRKGVEQGLERTLFGVTVRETTSEDIVGMGRVVGDGGCVFHICDMAVLPSHQGQGLGTRIMDAILAYIDDTAPPRAYVNLMADVRGFYEKWGFEYTAPNSRGMAQWTS